MSHAYLRVLNRGTGISILPTILSGETTHPTEKVNPKMEIDRVECKLKRRRKLLLSLDVFEPFSVLFNLSGTPTTTQQRT